MTIHSLAWKGGACGFRGNVGRLQKVLEFQDRVEERYLDRPGVFEEYQRKKGEAMLEVAELFAGEVDMLVELLQMHMYLTMGPEFFREGEGAVVSAPVVNDAGAEVAEGGV